MTFAPLQRALARLRPQRPTTAGPADATPVPASPRRRRGPGRRTLLVSGLAVALAATGAGVSVARAHKVITLDVDGQVQQVTTYAGAVSGLVADQAIALGEHDALTPSAGTALSDGATVVVRHARELDVVVDGEQVRVWSTALTADEALGTLAARGADVALAVSRSADGRAQLPVDLRVTGQVEVVADGQTRSVDGAQDLASALAAAGVSVAAADRVAVRHAPQTSQVTVVVNRVLVADQVVDTPVEFATVTQETDELYRGQERTVTQGAAGVHRQVFRVTTVDGVEETRTTLYDAITVAPVDAVVQVGTRSRPVAAAPAASSGGSAVGGDVWAALAQCESGGNPTAVSSSGRYFGLYQFSLPTWQAMGGSGLPSEASADEQTQRAQALQARSGWGQWPACARKLGLL